MALQTKETASMFDREVHPGLPGLSLHDLHRARIPRENRKGFDYNARLQRERQFADMRRGPAGTGVLVSRTEQVAAATVTTEVTGTLPVAALDIPHILNGDLTELQPDSLVTVGNPPTTAETAPQPAIAAR